VEKSAEVLMLLALAETVPPLRAHTRYRRAIFLAWATCDWQNATRASHLLSPDWRGQKIIQLGLCTGEFRSSPIELLPLDDLPSVRLTAIAARTLERDPAALDPADPRRQQRSSNPLSPAHP
jgi:hypothetical protein